MKEEQCYFIDENVYSLVVLNFNIQMFDYARPSTSFEDVKILFGVNVYKDVYPEILDGIVANYFNLFIETGRVIDILEDQWM